MSNRVYDSGNVYIARNIYGGLLCLQVVAMFADEMKKQSVAVVYEHAVSSSDLEC